MAIVDLLNKLEPLWGKQVIPDPVEQIGLFEQRFGALPADYREYLASDGREVFLGNNRVRDVVDEPKGGVGISCFYGLGEREGLIPWNETYHGRIPAGLIAIGGSGGGDQILLDIAGPQPGSTWFWDHEGEGIPGFPQPMYSNMVHLSTSFTQLVERIVREKGPDGPSRVVRASLRF